ncbi:hypothetical protein Pint_25752 [Pistacia integerrima]|uniref:Uncharacterized protein n=1 Tax=Pistacia integerrima TaxID=434235 RepID=A0ACC0YBC5_9ROSI|nr:hypothetical protein Pint_25752 [Pistacia integerrima]
MMGFIEKKITFIFNRQNDLIQALNAVWPKAHLRFCARHIYANFRCTWPEIQYKRMFWEASRAINEEAWHYLENIRARHWPEHAFHQQVCCDSIADNTSESFNAWIDVDKNKPIVTLLENYLEGIWWNERKALGFTNLNSSCTS